MDSTLLEHHLVIHALEVGQVLVVLLRLGLPSHLLMHHLALRALHHVRAVTRPALQLSLLAVRPRVVEVLLACLPVVLL